MGYKDRLERGSFRGVSFLTKRHSLEGGRRVQVHEYPFKDEIFTEDLGKKADKFSIEAYFLGDDYDLQRNALLEALNTQGAGTFIHPAFGRIEAVCTEFSQSEDFTKAGRQAKFRITFYRLGSERLGGKTDEGLASEHVATDAILECNRDFEEEFNTEGAEQSVLDLAIEDLGAVSRSISDIARRIRGEAEPLSELSRAISDFEASIASILGTPSAITGQVRQLYASIFSIARTASIDPIFQAEENLKALFVNRGFSKGFRSFASITPSDQRALKNRQAIIDFNTRLSAIYASNTALDVAYPSSTAATNATSELNAWFFGLENTNNVAVFEAIQALRIQSAKALKQKASVLAKEESQTLIKPLPSLAFAKVLGASELDVVALNSARDPLFLKGEVRFVKDV